MDSNIINKLQNEIEQLKKRVDALEQIHSAKPRKSSAKNDPLIEDVIKLVAGMNTVTVSFLQRRLDIGFSRAGRIMDELEKRGIISKGIDGKPRKVLIKNLEDVQK